MKVYVIKRNNGTYYKRYFENYVQFEDEMTFAEMHTIKSGAENTMDFITRNKYRFNILPEELSIVECSLMEATELADYTKQVRKEVLDQVYKVFTTESMWKELKDWWLQSGTCKELRDCLDAIAEDPSVENIVMRFGRDRNLYEWLKELQSKDN